MILNERLFENTSSNEDKELSIEDMFKYLKEYPQYNHQYTRPVKYNNLGLSDEQVDEFFEFLNDEYDGLDEFWNQNAYLAQNIYQEGRLGGHLVLDSDILEPMIFDDEQSVSDMVEHNLEDNYDPNNDDGTYDERQKQTAREEIEKEIKDSYITLKDFDDRVNELIDNLKATLDARIENKANNKDLDEDIKKTESGKWVSSVRNIKVEPGYHEWIISVNNIPYYSFGDITDILDIYTNAEDFANDELENFKELSFQYFNGNEKIDSFTDDAQKIGKLTPEETANVYYGIIDMYNYYKGLTEDIEKTKSGKWVNVGKEGTHGEFTTKKAAREQQKAMFAQGFKGEALENIQRFKWELFDQNDNLIDSESGFASEEEAKQNAIREIDVYDTILKRHPEYTFRVKEFVENIDSDDDRFDMVDDTNESFDPASVVDTIREFLQEHPFENEAHNTSEDFEEYVANELFNKEVKELTSEESYAISEVWESLNESLGKESFKPISHKQAKKCLKVKDESLYQTDSVSGNKMTFEVSDDGKFIVKDGEKVILNTKVVDVQDTRNQIKSMQDIEILQEDLNENLDDEVAKEVEMIFSSADETFPNRMLSRLKSDFKYILGAVKDNAEKDNESVSLNTINKHLWFHDIDKQAALMKEIYERLDEKPEDLTLQDIDNFVTETKQLLNKKKAIEEDLEREFTIFFNREGFEHGSYGVVRVKATNEDEAKSKFYADKKDDKVDIEFIRPTEDEDIKKGIRLIEDLNENPGDEEEIDPTAGLETVLNDLINDENEAINGYNSAIVNFEVEGRGDLTQVFRDIIKDEQNHIGNLQKVLNEINPDTLKNIQDGQEEAEETLQSDSNSETEETNE